MELIISSDIFGRTPELEDIASELSSNFTNVILIDPYENKHIDFENENAAYTYFQKNIGLDRYIKILFESVIKTVGDLRLLGFSVGASALWAISDKMRFGSNTKAICFYGSQIRNLLKISPKIEINIFFPQNEPHFDVGRLISRISNKSKVRCFQTIYLHGFMNRRSESFNESGYLKYLQILKDQLA